MWGKTVLLGVRIRKYGNEIQGIPDADVTQLNGLENGGEMSLCSDSHITYNALRSSAQLPSRLRTHADGRDRQCTTRTEPPPSRQAHRSRDTIIFRELLVFERKHDGAIDCNREATVSPSEHDKAHYKLR
jgi:hypothetical protein